MLIFIFVIIGLAVLILGHEAGHFWVAKAFGLKIDEFGFGFPPRLFARKKGEVEYSFNWLPFGGFVKIAGEEDSASGEFVKLESLPSSEKNRYFFFQPAWKRFLVIAAGVAVNFLIGWLLISFVFMAGSAPLLVVGGIQNNSPAEKAGIMAGDIIKNYTAAKGFIDFVNQRRGQPIIIEIRRGSENLNFNVVPRTDIAPNEGALGVLLSESGVERLGVLKSFAEGFKQAVYASGAIFFTFYALMKNLLLHGSLLTGVVGPIGIFSVAQETGKIGMVYLVQLIGLISINLAVINLIPFPALDGGRLFLILAEKIKGSPIPFKFQAWANRFGFVLLLVLMAFVTIRDIAQWF
ncbi:MAG: site-2 protease family protein [Candidatus Liptonbacteria bacterium]|nr:site-2 protease family protein [Candidatus Liptonbacteria bacterium]